MKNGYKNLVRYALDKGLFIKVDHSQERQNNYKLIIEDIEAVEDCSIFIFEKLKNGKYKRIAWAFILPFDGKPDETVINYSANAFMDSWEKHFSDNEN